MSFLYPHFLWLLIPLILFFIKAPQKIVFKIHFIILLLIIIALTRPIKQETLQKTNIVAKDIIIAIDVSSSMNASDIKPSRYLFAKQTIHALLKDNPADNIMLIAFTTNPLLLSPPTTDHTLISVALENLNPSYILTKGTSLKNLFTQLVSLEQKDKILILISDGGEEKNIHQLSALLQQSHLSLITLALGSKEGSTLTNKDNTLLKDKEGNLVITRINPSLKTLTSSVGGIYLLASSSPKSTAKKVEKALETLSTQTQNIEKIQHRYLELYQMPLFLALLLFFMVHTRAVKYLLLLSTLLGIDASASMLDDYHLYTAYHLYTLHDFNASQAHLKKIQQHTLQSKLTLANTYYKTHDYKKAIDIYHSIRSTSKKVKQQLYYNMANTYVQLSSYNKAKIYYTKALQLGFDKDASYNLGLIAFAKDANLSLGMTQPKSQSAHTSKNENQETEKKNKNTHKQQSSSGSGSGNTYTKKAKKTKKMQKNLQSKKKQSHPLSSKVYDLINKGYIHEIQPW